MIESSRPTLGGRKSMHAIFTKDIGKSAQQEYLR